MAGIGIMPDKHGNPDYNRRGKRHKLVTNISRLKELLTRGLERGQHQRISDQLSKAERDLVALKPTEGR